MLVAGNNKKDNIRKKIIKHLFFYKELSSNELSDLIEKSIPFTTQYLNELLAEKIIEENGYAVSTGGRRPQIYSLKEDLFYIVSVGMDQLVTRIVMVSSANNYVGTPKKYELKLANNPDSLQQLIAHLKSFISESKIPLNKIAGIGIGMPGFVAAEKGINYTFLPAENGTIVSTIEKALHLPVFIDNDSSLIALAELKWGAARHKEDVMVINIGWGVGLGIISNGKLLRGHDGFAGEFSHIPLFDNNKLCSCGKYGCLETETSLVVLAQKAIKNFNDGVATTLKNIESTHIEDTAKKIIDAAQRGDKFCIEMISESAYHIGRGVAILIHLLNPELIVISGLGSIAGKIWIAPIQQAVNEHCIPKIAEHAEIKISTMGYNGELVGAAALVMDNYDRLPLNVTKTAFSAIKQMIVK